MPLPDISLAQFNRIASGKYNAGLVDFKTDDQGQVTGLDKVNHHIHKTGKNTVELSPERIVEVKEAFIAALERGGVKPEDMTKIRKSLGLPEDLTDSLRTDARHEMMNRRFTPLTRQQVRGILDKFARQGRGFTMESQAEVSFDDAVAAAATAIATKELGQNGFELLLHPLKAKDIVMKKLIDDTNSMGGDKSYQIDIGV